MYWFISYREVKREVGRVLCFAKKSLNFAHHVDSTLAQGAVGVGIASGIYHGSIKFATKHNEVIFTL